MKTRQNERKKIYILEQGGQTFCLFSRILVWLKGWRLFLFFKRLEVLKWTLVHFTDKLKIVKQSVMFLEGCKGNTIRENQLTVAHIKGYTTFPIWKVCPLVPPEENSFTFFFYIYYMPAEAILVSHRKIVLNKQTLCLFIVSRKKHTTEQGETEYSTSCNMISMRDKSFNASPSILDESCRIVRLSFGDQHFRLGRMWNIWCTRVLSLWKKQI